MESQQPVEQNIVFDENEIKGSGQAKEWVLIAEGLTVTDEDSVVQAADILHKLSDSAKSIEQQRKTYTVPINNELSKINAVFKNISTPLETAITGVKGLILNFRHKQKMEAEKLIREREREEREAAEAHRKELLEAEKAGEEAPAPPQPMERPHIEVGPSLIKGDHGGHVHTRANWKYEIITPSKVPGRFTSPDEKKIKAAVKLGVREIPGVRIFNEPSLAAR